MTEEGLTCMENGFREEKMKEILREAIIPTIAGIIGSFIAMGIMRVSGMW